MKVQIPEQLKADVPLTVWGKILTATPVIMTVLATMLAGLASSEMTRAQYDRALAAQQQSKAGDQWNFFQAKRLRGALQRNTIDLLRSTAPVRPLDEAGLRAALTQSPPSASQAKQFLDSEAGKRALTLLRERQGPAPPSSVELDANMKAAIQAVENVKPEAEIQTAVASVNSKKLEETIRQARDAAADFDESNRPMNQVVDQIEAELTRGNAPQELTRDFIGARLHYTAARYESEARLNQTVANLYELQVRQSNMSAARHHARSQRFFLGMLTAQAAVIIATFAIAARKRNLLWSMAAAAGAIAVAVAIYVYFYV